MEGIEKIVRIEEKVSSIIVDITKLNKKVEKHEEEISSLCEANKTMEIEMVKIQKDVESIKGGITRVEKVVNKTDERLDKIVQTRIEDHYVSPMENYKKIAWIVGSALIAFIIGVVIRSLFPHV